MTHAAPVDTHTFGRRGKEIFDRVIAALLLGSLTPLMLVIALLVRLSGPGPVLFAQSRGGYREKPFVIYKFRTMIEEAGQDDTARQAEPGDKRITPLGVFLRTTSLDELPQLWNVLKGEMSLIGPRPHPLAHDAYYRALLPDYVDRMRMKPGMTGLAQIQGVRGHIDVLETMRRRVALDNAYIDGWSFDRDMRIAGRTAVVCFMWFGKALLMLWRRKHALSFRPKAATVWKNESASPINNG